MIIIQHLLPSEAGNESVASKLGQQVIYFTTNIGNFLLPIFIEKTENKISCTKPLTIGLTTIILGGIFGIIFLEITKFFFVDILFGEDYLFAKNWIKYFGIYGTFIGITHLIVQLNIAKNKPQFIYSLTFLTILYMISFYLLVKKDHSNLFNLLVFWSVTYALSMIIPLIKSKFPKS
jgi:hypothetical protein